jgi:hypothetical protein
MRLNINHNMRNRTWVVIIHHYAHWVCCTGTHIYAVQSMCRSKWRLSSVKLQSYIYMVTILSSFYGVIWIKRVHEKLYIWYGQHRRYVYIHTYITGVVFSGSTHFEGKSEPAPRLTPGPRLFFVIVTFSKTMGDHGLPIKKLGLDLTPFGTRKKPFSIHNHHCGTCKVSLWGVKLYINTWSLDYRYVLSDAHSMWNLERETPLTLKCLIIILYQINLQSW